MASEADLKAAVGRPMEQRAGLDLLAGSVAEQVLHSWDPCSTACTALCEAMRRLTQGFATETRVLAAGITRFPAAVNTERWAQRMRGRLSMARSLDTAVRVMLHSRSRYSMRMRGPEQTFACDDAGLTHHLAAR
jgi:hypothetical protein